MKSIVESKKDRRLNKILLVGHKYSNYEVVQEVLNKSGMENTSKLKKEDIEVQQISKILLKTNETYDNSQQIEVNPLWNGLAMDLMISNMDKEFWGWSDSEAISLLNYWKSIDNNLAFVLVYSTPNILIKKLLKDSSNDFEVEINEWVDYNRKLLDFYYRNTESSILVNSEQVSKNSKDYILELKNQLSLSNVFNNEIISIDNTKDLDEGLDYTYEYLIEQVIKENSILNNMYEELQSCANFPDNTKEKKEISYLNILSDYQNKEKKKLEKIEVLSKDKILLEEENQLILEQLFTSQEKLEELFHTNIENKDKINNLLKEKENFSLSLEEGKKNLSSKNSDNLQLKDDIKSLTLSLEEKNNELQNISNTLEEEKKNLSSKNSDNQKLNEQIKDFNNNLKSLETENEQLLTQLFTVQEELEKYFLQVEKTKKQQNEPKRYYGAANRIKQQLSYRLGCVMIENSKSLSGLLTLPFKLRKETKDYQKEQKNKEKLPPISVYADAIEAERLKNHLSYKLGYEIIQCFKSPLGIIKWPWAIMKAREEYKKGKKNV